MKQQFHPWRPPRIAAFTGTWIFLFITAFVPSATAANSNGLGAELCLSSGERWAVSTNTNALGARVLCLGAWDPGGLHINGLGAQVIINPLDAIVNEGEVEDGFLVADQNQDHLISLSELLRVIQFFNSDGFHCESGTEDGYAPGPGDTTCAPYDSDYNPEDWQISLSELLRVIQFFNSGGYYYCPDDGTEDGYCPGLS